MLSWRLVGGCCWSVHRHIRGNEKARPYHSEDYIGDHEYRSYTVNTFCLGLRSYFREAVLFPPDCFHKLAFPMPSLALRCFCYKIWRGNLRTPPMYTIPRSSSRRGIYVYVPDCIVPNTTPSQCLQTLYSNLKSPLPPFRHPPESVRRSSPPSAPIPFSYSS